MTIRWQLLFCVVTACGSEKTTGPTTTADSATTIDEGVATDTATDDIGSEDTATEDATSGASVTVRVGVFYYKPASVTIKVGDTVQWIWDGGTHSVTSGAGCTADGKFDSGNGSTPFTFKRTFTEAGTFPYFCKFKDHCSNGQKGTITVTP